MAKGGRYLHSQGVAHRDLKGENILLNINDGGDIVVKLADFGSAKGEVNFATLWCSEHKYWHPSL